MKHWLEATLTEISLRAIDQIYSIHYALLYTFFPKRRGQISEVGRINVVAHRGGHGIVNDPKNFVENTLEALICATSCGAHAIEFDVRWSKDDVAIVFHDPTLARLKNDPCLICECDFADLRSRHPWIPTLTEVIENTPSNTTLFIELKTDEVDWSPQRVEFLKKTFQALDDSQRNYFVLALDPEKVEALNCVSNSKIIPVVTLNLEKMLRLVEDRNYGGLTGHYAFVPDRVVEELNSKNLLVGTGFVGSKSILQRELARGVRWVFTNHTAYVCEQLKKIAPVILIFLLGTLWLPFAKAQETPAKPAAKPKEKYAYDISANYGAFLPSRIGGVIDVLKVWSIRVGAQTGFGNWEAHMFNTRSEGVVYTGYEANYRLDINHELLNVHFLIGGHADTYMPNEPGPQRLAVGWQYGGGVYLPVVGPLWSRADFEYRFGPGNSLLVVVGLAYRIPAGGDKD